MKRIVWKESRVRKTLAKVAQKLGRCEMCKDRSSKYRNPDFARFYRELVDVLRDNNNVEVAI